MAHRATMADVAREAGLSLSTVDRAINRRATVRAETREKIAEAAERVGYHARGLVRAAPREDLPKMRVGLLLLGTSRAFYASFATCFERALEARCDIRGSVKVVKVQEQSAESFAAALLKMSGEVDTIGCVAINHLKVTRAVQEVKDAGVPVFSLLSDFAQGVRADYVGTNNMKVGRSAAWLLTKTIQHPGKLALFVGGHRWHGHELRELGFRAYVRESAPAFEVLDTLVNLDTRQVTYEATLDLLSRHADLKGIYVAGGGMGGALDALREARPPGKVSLITNELVPESELALTDGYALAVISVPQEEMCRDLVELMVRHRQETVPRPPGQHFLRQRIDLAENL